MVVFAQYPLGETRVQREAEALIKQGYEVDVICVRMPGNLAVDCYKGVTIYREKYHFLPRLVNTDGLWIKLRYYINFFFTAGYRLTKLHLMKHYDTIQIHNLPDFLVFCALIPKFLGVPVILDLHDLMPELYAGNLGKNPSLTARLIRLQEWLACKFADHVITVTEIWRQALIQRGLPGPKCSVVMNVADTDIFHPSANGSLRLTGRDGFKLIYHGTMREQFGLDLAIQAINLVRHDIPQIHLTMVGGGEYLPHMKKMIEELKLGQYISIEPTRLAEELPQIINSCDLGIVPYRSDAFMDGALPTKLMEYAAMGLPAIAARTTAIQAYFSNTNTEFFEPGDADDLARCILLLYHNPERMAELARGSENFNRRYNWAHVSEAYVSLVERLGGVGSRSKGFVSSGSTHTD